MQFGEHADDSLFILNIILFFSFCFLSFDEMVTNSHCSAMAHDMNLYFLPSAVQLGVCKRKPYCNKKCA